MGFHFDASGEVVESGDGVVDADAVEVEGFFALGVVAHVAVEVHACAEGEGDVAVEEGVLEVEGDGPGVVGAVDFLFVVDVADVGVVGAVLEVDAAADGSDACVAVHDVGLEGGDGVEGEVFGVPVGVGLGDLVLGAFPVFEAGLHADAALEVEVPVGLELGWGVGVAFAEEGFVVGVVDESEGGSEDVGAAVGLACAAVADVPVVEAGLDAPGGCDAVGGADGSSGIEEEVGAYHVVVDAGLAVVCGGGVGDAEVEGEVEFPAAAAVEGVGEGAEEGAGVAQVSVVGCEFVVFQRPFVPVGEVSVAVHGGTVVLAELADDGEGGVVVVVGVGVAVGGQADVVELEGG